MSILSLYEFVVAGVTAAVLIRICWWWSEKFGKARPSLCGTESQLNHQNVVRDTKKSHTIHSGSATESTLKEIDFPSLAKPPQTSARVDKQDDLYRSLYHKVLNLEQYPEILPVARQVLLSLLLESASSQTHGDSIYALDTYTPDALQAFIDAEHENTLDEWEEYLGRRASGSGPDLFTTRAEAEAWLKSHAPSKYVDGAWLGHIHRITTPFHLRPVTRGAWQVVSEELGDGDMAKNHVHLYRATLEDIGIALPPGDSAAFVTPGHGMDDNNTAVWKGAVAQLLISLFPNEFLPEILGFNMHFEQLTLNTLKAAKELPLFGISGYYFSIHIAVDNADSGHTAMALRTVQDYMDLVCTSDGPVAAQQAWKRIQAGYQLSKVVGCDTRSSRPARGDIESRHHHHQPHDTAVVLGALSETESRLLKILENKARVSQRIHCASRVKIGNRTLADWLSPELWGSVQMQRELLLGLSQSCPWIRPGDSNKSLLVRELSWKGRMFGAFTHAEVEVVKQWIDSLGGNDTLLDDDGVRYWQWVGCESTHVEDRVITADHPVFTAPGDPAAAMPVDREDRSPISSGGFQPRPPLCLASDMDFTDLLRFWFTHQCLLENSITAPWRGATLLTAHIVRVLRAEYGFVPETYGVAGMDQNGGPVQNPSLVDLGLEMAQRHYDSCQGENDMVVVSRPPLPTCLRDVMEQKGQHRHDGHEDADSTAFALAMLHWSMYPVTNMGLLLGLARAFVDLEIWVTQVDNLLSVSSRSALEAIVERKLTHLQSCRGELEKDEQQARNFQRGYALGRNAIEDSMRAAA